MKKPTPSRKEIETAITPAFIRAVDALDMQEDATTLCRTMRALLGVMFSIAEAGGVPAEVVAQQIQRVGAKRFPRLKAGKPVLVMKEAKA